jgi:hypothetical protein
LKPLELNLQKLEDMMKYLIHEQSTIISKDHKGTTLSEALSSKMVVLSISTLIVIALVGLFEVLYLKKYWINRKLI